MDNADVEIAIRRLDPTDSFSNFHLGDPDLRPLKTFAKRDAKKYEDQNLARSYVALDVNANRMAGYITLSCGEVSVEDNANPLHNAEEVRFTHLQYPAVKIARLAVDQNYRGGLGRALVQLALGIARERICPAVGCRFVMVDAKQQSIGFYEKCGFTLIDTPTNKARQSPVMYLDLKKAG